MKYIAISLVLFFVLIIFGAISIVGCTKDNDIAKKERIDQRHLAKEDAKILRDLSKLEESPEFLAIKSTARASSVDLRDAQDKIFIVLAKIESNVDFLDKWDEQCTAYSKNTIAGIAADVAYLADSLRTLETEFESFAPTSPWINYLYPFYKPYIDARVDVIEQFANLYIDVINEPHVTCGRKVPRLWGRISFMRSGHGWVLMAHNRFERYIP